MRFFNTLAGAPVKAQTSRALALLLLSGSVLAAPAPALPKRDSGVDSIIGLAKGILGDLPAVAQLGTDLLNTLLSVVEGANYVLPQNAGLLDGITRTANKLLVTTNFIYGPAVGGGPYYPTGVLGIAASVADVTEIQLELVPELALAVLDAAQAELDQSKYNGLKTLDDYNQLTNGEWTNSAPNGPDPGVQTNYTQDLFFSMQRLANSPNKIRRVNPASDTLQFTISDSDATKISGMTMSQLFQAGRLFYADYRDQTNLTRADRYSDAVDAYFYINPTSGDFLPLAIRLNVYSNLIYTPLDSPNDWLLAKMIYNVNDFWFAQWTHLSATHQVVQIIWMAAIRSLSNRHPVWAILSRPAYEAFAVQMLAKVVLFAPGGAVDLVFPFTGTEAQDYSDYQYHTGGAGKFQSNYFETDLLNRGLVNATYGPALKHFPFYEDASVTHTALRTFMTTFVNSYYSSDSVVAADSEIQAWVSEANGAAGVLDFPAKITTRKTLIEVLTQFAHLVSSAHHAVNTNELQQVSSTLPFTPPALYKAIPTAKSNTTNPVEWLPPLSKVLEQFTVGALFSRPLLVNTNRTLTHMFDDASIMSMMNSATQKANTVFMSTMNSFSATVQARTFDANGLCQGMPFVWKALDPNTQPYSGTI